MIYLDNNYVTGAERASVSIHRFKTVGVKVFELTDKANSCAEITFTTEHDETLTLDVFGPRGKINALSNCLNAEFNPQPELPNEDADSYDFAADDFNFDSARERAAKVR